jgi:S-DNA-T family DNA segregation ATPase FtsK/SpoIIIE
VLRFDVGADTSGAVVTADLTKAPHLLIAGATGSGKSVMIHNIVAGLLEQNPRLILIDLKMVELAPYDGLPQLLVPVIFEAKQAAKALKWATYEMDRRYRLLLSAKVRDIDAYNEDADERLDPIVIVIDELADLMLSDEEIEEPIVRLAQKARAAGIHLVLATQRPSVDVVTGLIKANVPSRIAFTTASHIDSRTIIDTAGAESLNGRGDMLYKPPDRPKPIRLQGVFVSPESVAKTIERYHMDNT